jgi:chromosome segregation ATPase
MSEETLENRKKELEARIRELEDELAEKDSEIIDYLYKLEQLEAEVTQFEQLVPEGKKRGKKKQAAQSKMALKLKEKDEEIRELKNRMGFLRKEKVQLQQEYEKFKKNQEESSVIRVEDLRQRPPLNALVTDLQDKVNKQKSQINRLNYRVKEAVRDSEKLQELESVIDTYKSEIDELNQKLKELSSPSDNESGDSIAKKLIEDLQKQLNKSKREIIELKQKLSKKTKKSEKRSDILKINKLGDQVKELNELIKTKNNEIKNLKNDNVSNGTFPGRSDQTDVTSSEMIKKLKEDLQNQLNKSKLQVRSLQEQVRKYESGEISGTGETQKEMEGKLKLQREMAMFLEKQLKTKEGEVETIKNEAVQIKKRYRQLENQLKLRDQKLNDLQKQINGQISRAPIQPQQDPQLSLRLRELKVFVQDLEKKNLEQRVEIAQLRKK